MANPVNLDVMMEAVAHLMGYEFADMLDDVFEVVHGEGYIAGQMQSYGTLDDSVFGR